MAPLKCMKATSGLRPRRLAEVVPQRMSEEGEPVVILTGPRTMGKSTLLAAEFDRPGLLKGLAALLVI
jgi:hypothetical protein